MTQVPKPIPCGGSGTISSDSDETSESLHYGTSLQAATLQDEATTAAFNRAWHGAMKAKCGKDCFPHVDSVKIEIHSISFEYQNLVSALYWEAHYTCRIKFSWSANVSCTTVAERPGMTLPEFAKETGLKFD